MQNFYINKTNNYTFNFPIKACRTFTYIKQITKSEKITLNQQTEVRVLKDHDQDTLNSFAFLNNGKCTSGDCSVGLYVYEMD